MWYYYVVILMEPGRDGEHEKDGGGKTNNFYII